MYSKKALVCIFSTYCTIDRQTSPTCLEQERGSGAGYGTLIENPEDGSTTNYIYSTTAAAAQQTTFFNTTSSPSRSDSDEREVESAVLKGILSPRPAPHHNPETQKGVLLVVNSIEDNFKYELILILNI